MLEKIKKICNRWFITAFSGMASGLFCTLIAGTIIALIASWVGDNMLGYFLSTFATLAKILMGAGIGIGIAYTFEPAPRPFPRHWPKQWQKYRLRHLPEDSLNKSGNRASDSAQIWKLPYLA